MARIVLRLVVSLAFARAFSRDWSSWSFESRAGFSGRIEVPASIVAASWSVEISGTRMAGRGYVSIKDTGPGFDWRAVLRSNRSRGPSRCRRVISHADNGMFDELVFSDTGNLAVGFVAKPRPVQW